jgi:hypothetical protein
LINFFSAVLDGVAELKIVVNNSITVSFESCNLSGGQYKKIFGHNIGGACDVAYEKHVEPEVRRYWKHYTNISFPYGTCPFTPEFFKVTEYHPKDFGDWLPPYLPGNERWRVTTWLHAGDKTLFGIRVYAIIRDNQKLFDSTWR